MKSINRVGVIIVIALASLLLTPAAEAGCRTVQRAAVVIHNNPVVAATAVLVTPAVAQFVAVPVAVNLYNTQYHPSAAELSYNAYSGYAGYGGGVRTKQPCQEAQTEIVGALKDVIGEIKELKAWRQRVEGGGAQVPVPPQPAPLTRPATVQPMPPADQAQAQGSASQAALQIFTSKCASCHDTARAQKMGGGFALTDGEQIVPLSDKAMLSILKRSYTDDAKLAMPRGGKPLSDQEYAALVAYASILK